MIDLWFGDSWPFGSELTRELPLDNLHLPKRVYRHRGTNARPDKAFSTIVSQQRRNTYVNFAADSTSLQYALHCLIEFLKDEWNSEREYTAFLCLTGQTRNFSVDINGTPTHWINNQQDPSFWLHNDEYYIPESDHAIKSGRKVHAEYCVYDTTIALNHFYALCKSYSIDLVIIPVWCQFEFDKNYFLVPAENFLIPPSNTLVKETFGWNWTVETMEDNIDLADDIEHEYIAPCDLHPNLRGHKKLATTILDLLKTKKQNT